MDDHDSTTSLAVTTFRYSSRTFKNEPALLRQGLSWLITMLAVLAAAASCTGLEDAERPADI
jgi:hypothetical protein